MGVDAGSPAQSDHLSILSGAFQNVAGIAIAALATFGVNVLVGRSLGADGLGVVTAATQAVYVASFATRAGMDMAVLRDVAIEIGVDRPQHIRRPVARAVGIAAAKSGLLAAVALVFAEPLAGALSISVDAARAAALGLPAIAVANVWLAATRGLKTMRPTLYVFWAGQPVAWIVLMLIGWTYAETTWMGAAAYSASWALAAIAAYGFWASRARAWPLAPLDPGRLSELLRYAAPRAPAALFAQLLFWADLFVLTNYVTATEVGVYSAVLRTGQVIVLFLTSVNLMFSPYVADLHNRGERSRLDQLFKSLTRWTLAATIPIFLLLMVSSGSVLRLFGDSFGDGENALRIMLLGQLVNVATGSVGFILIMVGRTGWDLAVYAGSLVLDLSVAFLLAPELGMEGAAVANAVTFGLSNGVRLYLVFRFLRIQPYEGRYLSLVPPTLAAAAVMVAVHAALDAGWTWDLVATGGAGFAVYLGLLIVVGLTPQERQGLARLSPVRGRR